MTELAAIQTHNSKLETTWSVILIIIFMKTVIYKQLD